jgi:hypothetical protein
MVGEQCGQVMANEFRPAAIGCELEAEHGVELKVRKWQYPLAFAQWSRADTVLRPDEQRHRTYLAGPLWA